MPAMPIMPAQEKRSDLQIEESKLVLLLMRSEQMASKNTSISRQVSDVTALGE